MVLPRRINANQQTVSTEQGAIMSEEELRQQGIAKKQTTQVAQTQERPQQAKEAKKKRIDPMNIKYSEPVGLVDDENLVINTKEVIRVKLPFGNAIAYPRPVWDTKVRKYIDNTSSGEYVLDSVLDLDSKAYYQVVRRLVAMIDAFNAEYGDECVGKLRDLKTGRPSNNYAPYDLDNGTIQYLPISLYDKQPNDPKFREELVNTAKLRVKHKDNDKYRVYQLKQEKGKKVLVDITEDKKKMNIINESYNWIVDLIVSFYFWSNNGGDLAGINCYLDKIVVRKCEGGSYGMSREELEQMYNDVYEEDEIGDEDPFGESADDTVETASDFDVGDEEVDYTQMEPLGQKAHNGEQAF